jgi:Tol biopolymer transport system component
MKSNFLFLLAILFIANSGCGDSEEIFMPKIAVSYDSDADWSPDGNSIIFIRVGNSLEGRKSAIIDYNITDSSITPIYRTWAADMDHPRYSPDGKEIIFYQIGNLYIIDPIKDSIRQITFRGNTLQPDWSPDGTKISYLFPFGDERGIYIRSINTGKERNIYGYAESPVWFPDGNSLAVISYDFDGYPQIVQIDTLGNVIAKLTDTPAMKHLIDIHQRTGQICFSQKFPKELAKLWIMNPDGSDLRELIDWGSDYPAFSPDGEWIAYTHTEDDDGSIWAIRPDGSDNHRLTQFKETE